MKKGLKRLVWLILIVAAFFGISIYSSRRPMEVEMSEAARGKVRQYVTEEAKTRLDTVRLISALTSGVAERIDLEPGDAVEAGQVITRIEDSHLLAQLRAMEAQIVEIEAMLDGVDAPLPKQAEIDAAKMRVEQAEKSLLLERQALMAAASDLNLAKSRHERVQRLFDREALPEDDLEVARRNFETAEIQVQTASSRIRIAETAEQIARLEEQALLARLEDTRHMRDVYASRIIQARARIEEISTEIARTEVISPISGVVIEKYHDSRGYVAHQAPLLKVGDLGTIEVESEILSDEVWKVKTGQRVILTARGLPPQGVEGRVKRIYPAGFTAISALGVEQQRVLVLIEFDPEGLALGPGYELDVSVITDERDDAVLVPSAAVFATRQGPAAFRVSAGRAELVQLETGIEGDDRIEVISGLNPGDVVIIRPPRELESGRRVTPLD